MLMLRSIHIFTKLYNYSRRSAVSYILALSVTVCLWEAGLPHSQAAEPALHKFVGAETCATAGCHGGADPKRFQFQYWKHADPHSKAFSTLTTARSARMAEDLKLGDATKNVQCTACHAPLHALPADLTVKPLKAIESVYQRHKGKGLEVLAINTGQDKATINAFMKKIGASYPALLDENSAIARSYGVVGLPTTFFIDGKGIVRAKIVGEADEATFERQVLELMK